MSESRPRETSDPSDGAPDPSFRPAPDQLWPHCEAATGLLKALAHEGRLMILCYLSSGERSVTELENLLASRQSAVSQQLARLRLDGVVRARRDGKTIYYSLRDPRSARILELIYALFCSPTAK
ncbi:MAG: winged helix-turn-helix transcriptional regulator [Rhodobacteraceae bacterium]|nr:winged helix-turn-helix transcriptional regulator [Paracoccaceae bacterium]